MEGPHDRIDRRPTRISISLRGSLPRPRVAGGLTIRLVEDDPQSCVIRFFDTNGTALVMMSEELMARDYLERFIQIGTSELRPGWKPSIAGLSRLPDMA